MGFVSDLTIEFNRSSMNWMSTIIIVGVLALTTGVVINYIISKRKFKRRTITGAQVFSSYEKSKLIPSIEGLGRLIAWLLIIGGIFLIIIAIV